MKKDVTHNNKKKEIVQACMTTKLLEFKKIKKILIFRLDKLFYQIQFWERMKKSKRKKLKFSLLFVCLLNSMQLSVADKKFLFRKTRQFWAQRKNFQVAYIISMPFFTIRQLVFKIAEAIPLDQGKYLTSVSGSPGDATRSFVWFIC